MIVLLHLFFFQIKTNLLTTIIYKNEQYYTGAQLLYFYLLYFYIFILRLTYPYLLLLFFDLFIWLPPFPSSFHLCCKESFEGSLLPSC